jgi:hypothetical protein
MANDRYGLLGEPDDDGAHEIAFLEVLLCAGGMGIVAGHEERKKGDILDCLRI